MTEKVIFLQLTVDELEALIVKASEKAIQKILGQSREKEDETLLTTQEVVSEFKVSRITLNNYRKSGKLLPFSKAGKQHAYRRCDCQKAFHHKITITNPLK